LIVEFLLIVHEVSSLTYERLKCANPVLFLASKKKLYSNFRSSFQLYRPLLALVNINYYRWQATWFWEYLVNIPISESTYEYTYVMIDL